LCYNFFDEIKENGFPRRRRIDFAGSSTLHCGALQNECAGSFWFLGARARKKNSDVDVLVNPLRGASLIELVGVSNFLEKKLGRKVDVVSDRGIKSRLKDSIYHDLVKL
jgi:predicted nucleotidyltransferase